MRARNMEFFDSHEQVKRLAKAGIKESQAEAIVSAMSISRNSDIASLATKDQLNLVQQTLKSDIDSLRQEVKSDIDSLRQEVKSDIEALRQEVKSDIALVDQNLRAEIVASEQRMISAMKDAKFDTLKWMLGMLLTILVALYFK